ncbi:hypothetical protein DKX38_013147 [Salix brachista]|uniref:Uncharacterized protein n=1 Tax=Salix brachista TaxID=2182728 RepID=A0A5N5LQE7_9ROSI|nr:hypothetical protein DKX38_013147 [Salix brachista]
MVVCLRSKVGGEFCWNFLPRLVPPVRLRHCPNWPETFFAHQRITRRASSPLFKKLSPQVEYPLGDGLAMGLRKRAGLAGHSRALIGVDPVDAMDKGKQIPPPGLTYVPRSVDHDMAVMVIGSGLGALRISLKNVKDRLVTLLLRIMGILICLMVIRKNFECTQHTVCRNGNSTYPTRR